MFAVKRGTWLGSETLDLDPGVQEHEARAVVEGN
jgi:hypothetical protein